MPAGQLMGTIEIQVFRGEYVGLASQKIGNFNPELPSESCGVSATGKKVLCSAAGESTITESVPDEYSVALNRGELLDTISLKYCAAVGLIQAGVLARPSDIYEHHRMIQKFNRIRRRGDNHEVDTIDLSGEQEKGENTKPPHRRGEVEVIDLSDEQENIDDTKPPPRRKAKA